MVPWRQEPTGLEKSSKTPFYSICSNHPEHFEIDRTFYFSTHTILFYCILFYSILLQSFTEMQDLFFSFPSEFHHIDWMLLSLCCLPTCVCPKKYDNRCQNVINNCKFYESPLNWELAGSSRRSRTKPGLGICFWYLLPPTDKGL